MRELVIGGQSVAPGSRQAIRIPVTVGLNGAELALWVHAVRGREDGPVLALLSGTHGGEWFSIESLRRLARETDLDRLRGTILMVPVANPYALALQTRNIPDESDSPDMNRIFPGPLTWSSDQLNAVVSREVFANATHMIDFHMGPWGSAFRDVLVGADFPKPGLAEETERLALVFGSPVIRVANVVGGFPGPRSSMGYAGGILGIPALGVELGGAGFGPQIEARWHQETMAGLRALMAAIGMIESARDVRPKRQLIYRAGHRVNPTRGGYLRSYFGGETLGQVVERGTLLGEIVSPYTFEVIEELRAPVKGALFYTARDYPVHPGDWSFGLADLEDGTARWVDNEAREGA